MRKMGKTLLSLGLVLSMALSGQCVRGIADNCNYISAAAKIKINKKKATIYVGKTVQLKVKGTKKKVTWKSSNKKVATVTSKGKVKGVANGSATITAKVEKKKYTCKVNVKSETVKNSVIEVDDIILDKNQIEISVGENAILNALVFPYNATSKDVIWISSNPTIATVKDGVVNAVSSGAVTITASAGDKTASCTVTVSQSYGSISGAITYYYNKYRGNVADTNADVFLIPTDGTAKNMPVLSSYIEWSGSLIKYTGKNYKVYGTQVDGQGNYTLQDIPVGEYMIFIISNKTNDGSAFSNKTSYENMIAKIVSPYVNSTNAQYLGQAVAYQKYKFSTINVKKDYNTVFSYDFGITFIS